MSVDGVEKQEPVTDIKKKLNILWNDRFAKAIEIIYYFMNLAYFVGMKKMNYKLFPLLTILILLKVAELSVNTIMSYDYKNEEKNYKSRNKTIKCILGIIATILAAVRVF